MSDFRRLPMGVDPYKPSSARIYNYMLGGKDYYDADQEYAERVLKVAPDSKALAQMSRRFLLRGVRVAAEAGVRQFIDIGAGIPISPSVHDAACEVDPSARVVSIDFDPVVFAHATASSSSGDTPMLADLRHPDTMIDRLAAEALIDFDKPVAFLVVGVLHFIMDDEHPADIIARLRAAMAPGSYLVLTHASSDSDSHFIRQATAATKGSTAVPRLRSHAEIASYLDGFTILDPGLAVIQDWLDDDSPVTRVEILGSICCKP
ncbi:SAM-dependent methyltransferase [Nocardia sp. NPDC051052]|uniref:SAM-dependent methyltransferase n=1 Tax=Nocardia sp. NPDC051052 TaxID=3364322 RepID=UPI0037ACED1E